MIDLSIAKKYGTLVRKKFAPYCLPGKCIIAGSTRRRKPEVKDIEIVCAPAPAKEAQFWAIREQLDRDEFWKHTDYTKNGDRYFSREKLIDGGWIKFDVFVVTPPSQWGVILALRTGPAEMNRRIMYELPAKGLKCEAGQLFRVSKRPGLFGDEEDLILVPTPEEEDFFTALGMEYKEPWKRR